MCLYGTREQYGGVLNVYCYQSDLTALAAGNVFSVGVCTHTHTHTHGTTHRHMHADFSARIPALQKTHDLEHMRGPRVIHWHRPPRLLTAAYSLQTCTHAACTLYSQPPDLYASAMHATESWISRAPSRVLNPRVRTQHARCTIRMLSAGCCLHADRQSCCMAVGKPLCRYLHVLCSQTMPVGRAALCTYRSSKPAS